MIPSKCAHNEIIVNKGEISTGGGGNKNNDDGQSMLLKLVPALTTRNIVKKLVMRVAVNSSSATILHTMT